MKAVAISGGLSEGSAAVQLARAIAEGAGADLEVVSLRSFARDIADALTYGFPSARLNEVFAKVVNADALIAVTPIYNALPSGLFISFFDVLPEGVLEGKPVALGASGGTPRHSLIIEHAMRPMFVYLHALVPTTAVYAATEDWGAPGEGFDGGSGHSLVGRAMREGRELRALVALVKGESSSVGPGPGHEAAGAERGAFTHDAKNADEAAAIEQFPDFVSFEQLLKQRGLARRGGESGGGIEGSDVHDHVGPARWRA